MQSYDFYAELKHTNNILMELPYFRQLSDNNELLHERIQSLKATIEYLESKNRRLSSKIVKYKSLYKQSKKVSKKQSFGNVIDLVSDDDSDDNVPVVVVDIKQEKIVVQEAEGDQYQDQGIQEEVVEDQEEVVEDQDEVVEEEVIEYEIVEVVEEVEGEGDQEEEVGVGEEVEEAEEAEGEGEEEEVVECEEAEEVVECEEEEVVEGEEAEAEEAEGDQEVEDEEEEAEEEEVVEGEEEEEAEVYDIEINGKTYYVQNEKDSPIYEADENGDISMEVGVYKKGLPTFF